MDGCGDTPHGRNFGGAGGSLINAETVELSLTA